jgi:hypothetical protein
VTQSSSLSTMRMFIRPVATLLLIVMSLEACHRWVPINPGAVQAIPDREQSKLRVTAGPSQRVLFAPRVEGAFLIGVPRRLTPRDTVHLTVDGRPFHPDSVAVALADIQSIEVSRLHHARTALFVAGIAGVTIALGAFAASQLKRLSGGSSCGFYC